MLSFQVVNHHIAHYYRFVPKTKIGLSVDDGRATKLHTRRKHIMKKPGNVRGRIIDEQDVYHSLTVVHRPL